MTKSLRIAIAGLGTVGCGVIEILQKKAELVTARAGCQFEITAVSSRDQSRDRPVDVSSYDWVNDPVEMAKRDDVDVVLEMIGGESGIAKKVIETALDHKKHVITANKALMAHHGFELADRADENGVQLLYEAAVGGGIPVIKTLRESFGGNKVKAVYGILNGTCNYILTEMRETGRDFEDVLADAQKAGYAEADPAFDIDGVDAAHKLCLIGALAFGIKPEFEKLKTKGIRNITASDITYAQEMGYRIKLLGITRSDESKIYQSVEPCLVQEYSTMGAVEGVFNTVLVDADSIDIGQSIGLGAGAGPTASSVVSDLFDLARGNSMPVFGIPSKDLKEAEYGDFGDWEARFYLHLGVRDRKGVLADVAGILRDHKVSVETMVQHGHDPENPVSIIMTLHKVRQSLINEACGEIKKLDSVLGAPTLLRIEEI